MRVAEWEELPIYHSPMQTPFAMLCLAAASSLAFAGAGPAVTKANVDGKGWVHLVTADGRDHTIRPQKWQAGGGFEDIRIASDGATVGWLADAMLAPFEGNTNYSYAVALELDVWREGHVVRRFKPPSFAIRHWMFLKGGNEVAFHVAPAHGQEFYECTLFDVTAGTELARWELDRRDYVVPEWAKPLLVDHPLPGPDEISNWFPANSVTNEKTSKPQ